MTERDYNDPQELLAVVNDKDEEYGAFPRCFVHEKRLLHRAVHVLVFRSDGRIIIQQRSSQKDTFPLHWECVGGHLAPGEEYGRAAVRELEEELGIRASGLQCLGKLAASPDSGYEFIEVYRVTTDEDLTPNRAEITAVAELTLAELVAEIEEQRRPFSPIFVNTLKALGLIRAQAES